jgi:membrane associated rhomboid family serine protease
VTPLSTMSPSARLALMSLAGALVGGSSGYLFAPKSKSGAVLGGVSGLSAGLMLASSMNPDKSLVKQLLDAKRASTAGTVSQIGKLLERV